jgi:hypothetical protein
MGLCQTHYARRRRGTLHFYCERCDDDIVDGILRLAQSGMRVTLCYRCMERLGVWITTQRILEATYGMVTDQQVDAWLAGVDVGQLWAACGPGDPEIRARYGLDR